MAILVDSAVYIDLLRAKEDPRQVLAPYLRACEIYSCGVVRVEVLRGISSPRLRMEMQAFFDIVPEVPTDVRMWRQVTEIASNLARVGKWPPVTDLVIAASAIRVGATLVSPDKHFVGIEGLKVRKEL